MSRKNVLISAALTAFVIVVLANVSAVYARIHDAVTVPSQPTAQPAAGITEALPVQDRAVQTTHQEAASFAASFLGQNDLYSVENAVWNGVDAYKVVFSSGTIVYVGMDGQILGTEAPQPILISAPAQNNNNQLQPASAASHSEDHDEHEEYEDHAEREGHDD